MSESETLDIMWRGRWFGIAIEAALFYLVFYVLILDGRVTQPQCVGMLGSKSFAHLKEGFTVSHHGIDNGEGI